MHRFDQSAPRKKSTKKTLESLPIPRSLSSAFAPQSLCFFLPTFTPLFFLPFFPCIPCDSVQTSPDSFVLYPLYRLFSRLTNRLIHLSRQDTIQLTNTITAKITMDTPKPQFIKPYQSLVFGHSPFPLIRILAR